MFCDFTPSEIVIYRYIHLPPFLDAMIRLTGHVFTSFASNSVSVFLGKLGQWPQSVLLLDAFVPSSSFFGLRFAKMASRLPAKLGRLTR